MANDDNEIILGTGTLLGLFFGLVILCALFFGLGYSWGKKSAQASAGLQLSDSGDEVPVASDAKPSATTAAAPPASPINCPTGDCTGNTPYTSPSVAEPTPAPNGEAVPPGAQPSAQTQLPAPPQPAQPAAQQQAGPQSETAKPSAPSGGYIVQVAAVSKQEDAEALVAALKQKNYPVFIAPGTQSDKYFHVQMGPFADEKAAEAMKAKLLGDGYNAIVKK